jgi:hypothetical protein
MHVEVEPEPALVQKREDENATKVKGNGMY